MTGFFIFNGVNSRDHGIVIESYPQSCHAPRRGTLYEIAGRNGSGVDEDGTYGTYTQPYNINVREGQARRADLRSSDLAQWLTGERGFLRLEDSFEPEYFRLARFAGPINIDQLMGRWGRAQIEFECQPERYLVGGEKPYNLRINDTITNPTGRTAFPRLRVTGSGTVYVTVENDGETLCEIMCNLGTGRTLKFDSADYTVVDENGDNASAFVSWTAGPSDYHQFPELRKGSTTITTSGTGSVTALEIIPRWWTL